MNIGNIVAILFICVVLFFILYYTEGAVLSDLKAKRNKYRNIALKLVSAGSVDKEYSTAIVCIDGSFFAHERINADNYTLMVVDGTSMDRFGIKDGSVILVDNDKSFSYNSGDTVFVLKINKQENGNKIEYKLRRAIDFYHCNYESKDTFDTWIKNHPELNASKLRDKYESEQAKIEECKRLGCRLLISETTRDGDSYYSFHPESYIYGKVKYRIPKETVEIIEKR
jgi:hypothetical protein